MQLALVTCSSPAASASGASAAATAAPDTRGSGARELLSRVTSAAVEECDSGNISLRFADSPATVTAHVVMPGSSGAAAGESGSVESTSKFGAWCAGCLTISRLGRLMAPREKQQRDEQAQQQPAVCGSTFSSISGVVVDSVGLGQVQPQRRSVAVDRDAVPMRASKSSQGGQQAEQHTSWFSISGLNALLHRSASSTAAAQTSWWGSKEQVQASGGSCTSNGWWGAHLPRVTGESSIAGGQQYQQHDHGSTAGQQCGQQYAAPGPEADLTYTVWSTSGEGGTPRKLCSFRGFRGAPSDLNLNVNPTYNEPSQAGSAASSQVPSQPGTPRAGWLAGAGAFGIGARSNKQRRSIDSQHRLAADAALQQPRACPSLPDSPAALPSGITRIGRAVSPRKLPAGCRLVGTVSNVGSNFRNEVQHEVGAGSHEGEQQGKRQGEGGPQGVQEGQEAEEQQEENGQQGRLKGEQVQGQQEQPQAGMQQCVASEGGPAALGRTASATEPKVCGVITLQGEVQC